MEAGAPPGSAPIQKPEFPVPGSARTTLCPASHGLGKRAVPRILGIGGAQVRTRAELAKLAGRVVRTQPQGIQGRAGSGAESKKGRERKARLEIGRGSGSSRRAESRPAPSATSHRAPARVLPDGVGSRSPASRSCPGRRKATSSCCCRQRFPATRPASQPGPLPAADPALRGRGAKTRPGSPEPGAARRPSTARRRGKTRPG